MSRTHKDVKVADILAAYKTKIPTCFIVHFADGSHRIVEAFSIVNAMYLAKKIQNRQGGNTNVRRVEVW